MNFLTSHPAAALVILGALGGAIKLLWPTISAALIDRRAVRLTVHKAYTNYFQQCYFVNVTNLSRSRELEITHVWFDFDPQVPVMPPERRLPKRLRPEEAWATWIPVEQIPVNTLDVFTLGRIRLSTGKIIASKKKQTCQRQTLCLAAPSMN